ncbi:hypothetical protein ABGA94_00045, partial [Stenotrophomonas sp. 3diitr2024]
PEQRDKYNLASVGLGAQLRLGQHLQLRLDYAWPYADGPVTRKDDPRFAFGTWKIEILAGYTSAIALLGVAALMAVQSLERLWVPAPIHY